MNNPLLLASMVLLAVIVILFFIRKWLGEFAEKNKQSTEVVEWLKSVTTSLESSNQNVDRKLSENMKHFNERLDKAAYVIAEVQKNIGEFSEIGRGMKDLQQFLQSPKLRGNIGEQVLKDLLSQFLPQQSYVLQYVFKNGEKVDALIKTSNGFIPVDAKFPMENFKKLMSEELAAERDRHHKEFGRNVKKHIGDISKKYILPTEGTLDYAVMYVPSESVYYEIIRDTDLYDFASSSRVLIVSPMSFYAYLQAILMSFEGQKIEARAKEIITLLQSLKKDYEKTDEAFSILGRHITNAYNQVSNVSKLFLTFGQKLDISKSFEDKQTNLLDPSSSTQDQP